MIGFIPILMGILLLGNSYIQQNSGQAITAGGFILVGIILIQGLNPQSLLNQFINDLISLD
jgi:hypothetical protein